MSGAEQSAGSVEARRADTAVERVRRRDRFWARPGLEAALPSGLFTLLVVVLIVQDQGGYFPTSFGWSALALLAVFVVWLVAGGATDMGRLDTIFLGALVALAAWVGLSIMWSIDRAQSVLELERWIVLVAGCAALLVLARRASRYWIGLSLLVAIASICGYSLWTRLQPSAAGFDPGDQITSYRLSDPVGYWNALGCFAVMGILLALGYACERGGALLTRILAALALTVLPLTLYFTFSRGAWLALAGGLLVTLVVAGDRLRLVSLGALFSLPSVVAIVLATRSEALIDQKARLAAALHQGGRLGLLLIGLAAVAALLVVVVSRVEPRVRPGRSVRRAYGGLLLASAAILVIAVLVHEGGPVSAVTRAYDSFAATAPPTETANLDSRLFSVNSNGRALMWEVAIDAIDGHWLTGRGAGSFERSWEASPRDSEPVRDAHGLYVETLSELGVVGLVLLLVVLALPLIAGTRLRASPLVPAMLGGYSAFLIHNAIDWDWELSGVALTGLFLGCLLLVGRRSGVERILALPARVGLGLAAAVLACFAVVAVIGNGALARAQTANDEHRYAAAAADAELARSWMPWSPEPLKALGQAQLEQDQIASAAASFRRAVSIDPGDWQSWLDLAAALKGPAQKHAIAEAKALYPTSQEIEVFEYDIAHPAWTHLSLNQGV